MVLCLSYAVSGTELRYDPTRNTTSWAPPSRREGGEGGRGRGSGEGSCSITCSSAITCAAPTRSGSLRYGLLLWPMLTAYRQCSAYRYYLLL
eukprot:2247124-Rhodomonas_salina.1